MTGVPATGHTGPPPGPAPAAPGLDLVSVHRFTAADSTSGPHEIGLFDTQTAAIHGPLDPAWQAGKPFVTFHDMARRVHAEVDLTGVDLVVVVDASPDCRHQSLPACHLSDLMGSDPLIIGITDQGPTAPFTALRVAYDRVAAGRSGAALVLVLEQSTLPPEDGSPAPDGDTAVALLVRPGGQLPISRPRITPSTGRTHLDAMSDAGSTLTGWMPSTYVDAVPGHVCAGPWVALAAHLADAQRGGVLVAGRDLRYSAEVVVGVPAPVRELEYSR
ncbi:hypothetical protein ACFQV2_21980 [Actinokineospora soli]|uniref:Uncharacterized protein n=1 Tax=Actinokineospora soli TaxID=1048753 RepID=A0ABW2TPZ5_9PSEU